MTSDCFTACHEATLSRQTGMCQPGMPQRRVFMRLRFTNYRWEVPRYIHIDMYIYNIYIYTYRYVFIDYLG